ncbi:HYC_CC_PP family protein [Joostella sp. CR20]|uniref:HYC_CC_PP family protein n=1 Tax=Joostella sp. CR20 TaxID=2804312 RepID=UPI00313BB634
MKTVLRNISTLLMAMVVLFSTMSFTVDMHYCGSELVDVAFLKPAKDCGMEMQNDTTSTEKISKSHCCTDEHLVVEGQTELKSSFEKLSFHQQTLLVSYVFSFINVFEGLEENIIPFKNYTPPLLISEIQLENSTFLI